MVLENDEFLLRDGWAKTGDNIYSYNIDADAYNALKSISEFYDMLGILGIYGYNVILMNDDDANLLPDVFVENRPSGEKKDVAQERIMRETGGKIPVGAFWVQSKKVYLMLGDMDAVRIEERVRHGYITVDEAKEIIGERE